MNIRVLYFASLRAHLGCAQEQLEISAQDFTQNPPSLSALADYLQKRGSDYQQAFAERTRIRVAINQEYASWDDSIKDKDEIAFFPPVTGG